MYIYIGVLDLYAPIRNMFDASSYSLHLTSRFASLWVPYFFK